LYNLTLALDLLGAFIFRPFLATYWYEAVQSESDLVLEECTKVFRACSVWRCPCSVVIDGR